MRLHGAAQRPVERTVKGPAFGRVAPPSRGAALGEEAGEDAITDWMFVARTPRCSALPRAWSKRDLSCEYFLG